MPEHPEDKILGTSRAAYEPPRIEETADFERAVLQQCLFGEFDFGDEACQSQPNVSG